MRENERNCNWFTIESKYFKISTEGEGKKKRFFIIERNRHLSLSLWIRFGEEGRRKFLTGVEACCKDSSPVRKSFEWRENGRSVRLECKENDVGRFLLCSTTDVEGKNTG